MRWSGGNAQEDSKEADTVPSSSAPAVSPPPLLGELMSTSEVCGDVGISQVRSGQGAHKEYASEAACKDGGSARLAARGGLGGAEGRLEERLTGTELNGGRGEDAQVHVRVECRRDGEEVSVAKGNQRGHGHVTWRDRLPVHDARAGGLKEERVVGREDGVGGAGAGVGVVTRKWSSPVGSRTGLSHSLPRSLTPCPSLFPSSPFPLLHPSPHLRV